MAATVWEGSEGAHCMANRSSRHGWAGTRACQDKPGSFKFFHVVGAASEHLLWAIEPLFVFATTVLGGQTNA